MSKGAVALGYKHVSHCFNENVKKIVQFREGYTRRPLAQFAFVKFAQQNYETVTNQFKRCRQKITMLNLKTHFSPFLLVSQFYPGKFYYENIEGMHGQTQANSDSWSYWNFKMSVFMKTGK